MLFATSEYRPLMKTGGLGDASAGLCGALAARGVDLRVVMPAYRSVLAALGTALPTAQPLVSIGLGSWQLRLLETRDPDSLARLWLVDCPELFDRDGDAYHGSSGEAWEDNADRFTAFCRAVAWLACDGPGLFRPEIVHLNDWPSGLAAPLVAERRERPAVVFTAHNLQHQGVFDRASFDRLGLPGHWWHLDGVEFHGRWSFLKAGLAYADRILTVSPTHAREILEPEYGFGLDGLLRHRRARLSGILNGIEERVWNPATDQHIASHYDASRLERKRGNRSALRQQLGLPDDARPLLGAVTRLAEQKGVDLLIEAAPTLFELPTQLVVLGDGDPGYRSRLEALAKVRPDAMAFRSGFDEALAHRIEAGADVFLMPSRFEPCGLNQLYSMRYGTPPVARRTGGLADTIVDADVDPEAATGFLFDEPSAAALVDAVGRALHCFQAGGVWQGLQRNGMARDFSWRRSAELYLDAYRQALQQAPAARGGSP